MYRQMYRCTDRLLDSVRENSMYIIYSETDHQPRLDAWDKFSGLVHWEDPEESGGEGGGSVDQDGEYMSMYDKNHYNIVK